MHLLRELREREFVNLKLFFVHAMSMSTKAEHYFVQRFNQSQMLSMFMLLLFFTFDMNGQQPLDLHIYIYIYVCILIFVFIVNTF